MYICSMTFIIGFVLGAVAAYWYCNKNKDNNGTDYI